MFTGAVTEGSWSGWDLFEEGCGCVGLQHVLKSPAMLCSRKGQCSQDKTGLSVRSLQTSKRNVGPRM